MSSKTAATPSWEWAKALPAFVREKGWRAKAYSKGNKLQATYYHCSLFDVPPSFWAELLGGGDKERGDEQKVESLTAGMEVCGLTRGEGGREEEDRVLEGEEEEEGLGEGGNDGAGTKRMECRKCLCVFPMEERVAHYQSAWHLCNLRRGLARKPPVSLEEFDRQRQEGEGNTGGSSNSSSSSISGNGSIKEADEGVEDEDEESDEEGAAGKVRPDIQTESAELTLRRAQAPYAVTLWSVLLSSDAKRASNTELLNAMQHTLACGAAAAATAGKRRWAVLMLRSGKFAGAVFEGHRVLAHKAFRRYTVRAKAGGSQSAYDNQGRRAQSVGSQLRRYGEQKTTEDVRAVLEEWKALIEGCELLFLSLPKTMRGVMLGDEPPLLRRDDARLRSVPFMTEAPSFAETQAVHTRLATIRFSAPPSLLPSLPPTTNTDNNNNNNNNNSSSRSSSSSDNSALSPSLPPSPPPPTADPDWDVALATLILEKSFTPSFLPPSLPPSLLTSRNEEGKTLLHLAAEGGKEGWIEALLLRGANPCLLDLRDRPPYFLCANKGSRDAFRRARGREGGREGGEGGGGGWDWGRAGVPEGLTEEGERRRREKAKEKKKRAKSNKSKRKEGGEGEDGKEEVEEKEQEKEEEMEDLRQPKCDMCGKRVKVLYTRLEFVYCSTDCVQGHKRQLLSEAALRRFGGGL